jgi:hypothetical protein
MSETPLIDDLERLKGGALAGVARAMALLWDDFVDSSGGLDVFRSASEEDRGAYVGKIREIAEPYAAHPSKRLYALAANGMASYLELLARSKISGAERNLCRLIASMIDRGRTASTSRAPSSDEASSDNRSPCESSSFFDAYSERDALA